MKTLRLDGSNPAHIEQAAFILRQGGVVAIPTETVYGLAGDATSSEAVQAIYRAKGRPSHNPLIVHVNGLADGEAWAAWDDAARALAEAFWPGPLTLVLPNPRGIAAEVLAGGSTVGLRAPNHPVAQAVLHACARPLAAPSANASNALSPTTADAVLDTLDGRIDAVLDGGPCIVGVESTVLDLVANPPRILRPGMIGEAELALWLSGASGSSDELADAGAPLRSPGQLARHYAPRIPLLLVDSIEDHVQHNDALLIKTSIQRQTIYTKLMPSDAAGYAACLYAALRDAERSGAGRILLERPRERAGPWAAIHDRLRRAATPEK